MCSNLRTTKALFLLFTAALAIPSVVAAQEASPNDQAGAAFKPLAASGACYPCDNGYCDNCYCGDCCFEPWRICPQDDCGCNFFGWLNGGFIGNTQDPISKFNGPYNAVDRSNEPMFNQLYMIGERKLNNCCGCGYGGRVDVLYGEDFLLAQSVGLELRDDGSAKWNNEFYGIAIPQAYLEIGRSDLSLKLGHFYSIVGYEGVMAPYNQFYSKAYSYQFAGPFTHWGGLATWKPDDCWTLQAGLVNGWNTLDRQDQDSVNVLLGAKYTSCDDWWASFAIVTGEDINNPGGQPNIQNGFSNRTRYSLLAGVPLLKGLDYVFHHWLGTQQNGAVGGGQAKWYGIDQYLYYTINPCWKAGLRVEWFQDENGTRVGLNRPSNPNKVPYVGGFTSISANLNWTPTNNLIIRPEIRGDMFSGDQLRKPFDDGNSSTQFMIGCDAILQF